MSGWVQIISSLQRRYQKVLDEAQLKDATRELGDVSTGISGLPGEIEKLRERGYAYAGYLGTRATTLQQQWAMRL